MHNFSSILLQGGSNISRQDVIEVGHDSRDKSSQFSSYKLLIMFVLMNLMTVWYIVLQLLFEIWKFV